MIEHLHGRTRYNLTMAFVKRVAAIQFTVAALFIAGALVTVTGRPLGLLLVTLSVTLYLTRILLLRFFPHAFLPPEGLVGHRLALRPATAALIPAFDAMHDEEYRLTNHWPTETIELIHTLTKNELAWPFFTSATAMITPPDPADAGELFGSLSIAPSTNLDGAITIGAYMRKDKRGLGLFTEALELAFELFQKNQVEPIFLVCDIDNLAMMRSATKAGMIRQPDMSYEHPDGTVSPGAVFRWGPSQPSTLDV